MDKKARRGSCSECQWVSTGRKKYPWKCHVCDDVFPCVQKDCGHIDCHKERARSCHVCGTRIANTGDTFYFLDGKGTSMYAVHKGCADEDCVVRTHE